MTTSQMMMFGGLIQVPPITTFATWNPSDKNSSITLSGGNLTFTTGSGGGPQMVRGNIGLSSGKYYFEIKQSDLGSGYIQGIATASASLSVQTGNDAFGWSYFGSDGKKYNNGSGTAYGATYSSANTIGVAVDITAGNLWFAKDGVWQNSGDPVGGTNPAFTGLSGTFFPSAAGDSGVNTATANFGATAFSFSVPSGYHSGWGT